MGSSRARRGVSRGHTTAVVESASGRVFIWKHHAAGAIRTFIPSQKPCDTDIVQTLTSKVPFHGIQRVAQIVVMIALGHQPSREPGWDGRDIPDVLWEFMQACWSTSPAKRPSSEKIVHFIGGQLPSL